MFLVDHIANCLGNMLDLNRPKDGAFPSVKLLHYCYTYPPTTSPIIVAALQSMHISARESSRPSLLVMHGKSTVRTLYKHQSSSLFLYANSVPTCKISLKNQMAQSQFHLSLFLPSLLIIFLSARHSIHAVEYKVSNLAHTTPGGLIYNEKLGAEYTEQTMAGATEFIWNLFKQQTEQERKSVSIVSFFVEDKNDSNIAYTTNNEIHFEDSYIESISAGDIKRHFNGVLYHEMAHIWQWDQQCKCETLSNLTKGIADFVRLKADYVPLNGWVKPGEGGYWNEGYSVTARFLDYCNRIREGFVAELNKKLKDGYSEEYFVELLGMTPDQLFTNYKAEYGSNSTIIIN